MAMKMEKLLRINDVEDEVDHFACLPDDLALNILGRIDDANMLCKCTMVSKHFASKVYQMKSVRLRLPQIDPNSFEVYSDHLLNTPMIIYFEDDENDWPIRPSSIQKIAKIIAFLRNFGELESVDIESPCPKKLCTSPNLKWKAKVNGCEPFVTKLVSANPTLMCKLAEEGTVQEEEYQMLYSRHSYTDHKLFPLISCSEWLFLIFSLIKSNDSLRRVTCSDSHGHGAFLFEAEQQMAEWRKRLCGEEKYSDEFYEGAKHSGSGYDLRLPETGYLMRGVSYMLQDFPEEEVHGDLFLDMLNWEYGDDEKVLGEAMKQFIRSAREINIIDRHPMYPDSD